MNTKRQLAYFAEQKKARNIIAAGGYHVHVKKFKIQHDMSFSELRKFNHKRRDYKDVLKFPVLFNESGNVVEFNPDNFSFDEYKEVIQKLDNDYLTIVLPQKQKDRENMIIRFMNSERDDERSVAPESK